MRTNPFSEHLPGKALQSGNLSAAVKPSAAGLAELTQPVRGLSLDWDPIAGGYIVPGIYQDVE